MHDLVPKNPQALGSYVKLLRPTKVARDEARQVGCVILDEYLTNGSGHGHKQPCPVLKPLQVLPTTKLHAALDVKMPEEAATIRWFLIS